MYIIYIDEDDFSDVLGYLSEDAGQWQAISRNLHVKGGKITELIHSGQPAPTCLANAITDWLRLNYNHQRFGKPTWKKVAESVVKPTLINKRLFIRIAAEHTVKGELFFSPYMHNYCTVACIYNNILMINEYGI